MKGSSRPVSPLRPWRAGRDILHRLRYLLALLAMLAPSVHAAELIVVDQADCPYCERFEREIAPAWPNTEEGRDVPLRRVNLQAEWPADLEAVARATLTPTFILVDNGEEQGRLVGYAGDNHFWFLIGQLLDKANAAVDPVDSTAGNGAIERELKN